jgi:hypothetical protein
MLKISRRDDDDAIIYDLRMRITNVTKPSLFKLISVCTNLIKRTAEYKFMKFGTDVMPLADTQNSYSLTSYTL